MLYLFQVDVISLWMFDEYLFLLESCLSTNAVSRCLRLSCWLLPGSGNAHGIIPRFYVALLHRTWDNFILGYNWSNRWHCAICLQNTWHTFSTDILCCQSTTWYNAVGFFNCQHTWQGPTMWEILKTYIEISAIHVHWDLSVKLTRFSCMHHWVTCMTHCLDEYAFLEKHPFFLDVN